MYALGQFLENRDASTVVIGISESEFILYDFDDLALERMPFSGSIEKYLDKLYDTGCTVWRDTAEQEVLGTLIDVLMEKRTIRGLQTMLAKQQYDVTRRTDPTDAYQYLTNEDVRRLTNAGIQRAKDRLKRRRQYLRSVGYQGPGV